MPYPNGIPGVPDPTPQQLQAQQFQAQQLQDPSAIKLTRGTSCVLCQQRKVRCDKNKPCANCVKAKVECRVIPPQPPRRRKKRLQEKDLIDRLKKYETLLAEHGVKVDAIGHELRPDGPPGEDVDELENDFEGLKTTPEASSSPAPSNAEQRYASCRPDLTLSFESLLLTLLQDWWWGMVFLSQRSILPTSSSSTSIAI